MRERTLAVGAVLVVALAFAAITLLITAELRAPGLQYAFGGTEVGWVLYPPLFRHRRPVAPVSDLPGLAAGPRL